MRLITKPDLIATPGDNEQSSWETTGPMTHMAYHELSDIPVVESDAMTQLEMNLKMLEDLQGRLSFLMREVRYVMKA